MGETQLSGEGGGSGCVQPRRPGVVWMRGLLPVWVALSLWPIAFLPRWQLTLYPRD
jgi:hypothetical protein